MFNSNENVVPSAVRPSNIQTVQQTEDSQPATHLTFDQATKNVCTIDPLRNVTVSYEVFCDATVTDVAVTVDSTDLCNPKVSLTHKSGCPVFEATAII